MISRLTLSGSRVDCARLSAVGRGGETALGLAFVHLVRLLSVGQGDEFHAGDPLSPPHPIDRQRVSSTLMGDSLLECRGLALGSLHFW